jgi:hypothetical protein
MPATEFTVNLPKWPALVVRGESITREQAAVVLLRTQDSYSCNARGFEAAAYRACGMLRHAQEAERDYQRRPEGFDWAAHWQAIEQERLAAGKLTLNYLYNARITSAWVGGPKGWCAWDGTIGCDTFNIGKWPSVEEVLVDWTTIAQAFPWLTLRAQLWSEEAGFNDATSVPLVEFHVAHGTATAGPPTSDLGRPQSAGLATYMAAILRGADPDDREIGVPGATRNARLDYLRWAQALVHAQLAATSVEVTP